MQFMILSYIGLFYFHFHFYRVKDRILLESIHRHLGALISHEQTRGTDSDGEGLDGHEDGPFPGHQAQAHVCLPATPEALSR